MSEEIEPKPKIVSIGPGDPLTADLPEGVPDLPLGTESDAQKKSADLSQPASSLENPSISNREPTGVPVVVVPKAALEPEKLPEAVVSLPKRPDPIVPSFLPSAPAIAPALKPSSEKKELTPRSVASLHDPSKDIVESEIPVERQDAVVMSPEPPKPGAVLKNDALAPSSVSLRPSDVPRLPGRPTMVPSGRPPWVDREKSAHVSVTPDDADHLAEELMSDRSPRVVQVRRDLVREYREQASRDVLPPAPVAPLTLAQQRVHAKSLADKIHAERHANGGFFSKIRRILRLT